MNVRRHSLTFLITGGLITSLSACGGDDGGDDGADASGSETGPGTSGASNTMSTTQSSETLTTVDPSETDPSETDPSETDPTVDPDSSSGEPPSGTSFRFNSLAVRDPHFFAFGALDVTEDNVNAPLSEALNNDLSDPPDGFNDIGFVLAFDPLDQTEGGTGAVTFANAQCVAGADPVSCALLPASVAYLTTYTSQEAGTCQQAEAADLGGYDPAPQTTSGPCFVTAMASVTITTSSFSLPITNATVSARYVGDPAGNLVEGSIIGFVTQADADAALLSEDVMVVGGMPVSALLKDSDKDMDGAGWMFHIDYTAVPSDWTG
ncbi:MAG: hypothetical protein IAG13_11785 [Deltaproteobacteria bacterium]|nr:hypothetical protein [Nannocystaceae bacterium]